MEREGHSEAHNSKRDKEAYKQHKLDLPVLAEGKHTKKDSKEGKEKPQTEANKREGHQESSLCAWAKIVRNWAVPTL